MKRIFFCAFGCLRGRSLSFRLIGWWPQLAPPIVAPAVCHESSLMVVFMDFIQGPNRCGMFHKEAYYYYSYYLEYFPDPLNAAVVSLGKTLQVSLQTLVTGIEIKPTVLFIKL